MVRQETKGIVFVERKYARETPASTAIPQPVGAVPSMVVATEERICSNKHVKLALLGLNKHAKLALLVFTPIQPTRKHAASVRWATTPMTSSWEHL